jgi:hypothetical protein
MEHTEISTTPDIPQSSVWARSNRVLDAVYRSVAPSEGLNTRALMQGFILDAISDDANAFIGARITQDMMHAVHGGFHVPTAEQGRFDILERLDWEINTNETPEEIRSRLREVYAGFLQTQFVDQTAFDAGYAQWRSVRDWVVAERKNQPEWQTSFSYYQEHGPQLRAKYGSEINEATKQLPR